MDHKRPRAAISNSSEDGNSKPENPYFVRRQHIASLTEPSEYVRAMDDLTNNMEIIETLVHPHEVETRWRQAESHSQITPQTNDIMAVAQFLRYMFGFHMYHMLQAQHNEHITHPNYETYRKDARLVSAKFAQVYRGNPEAWPLGSRLLRIKTRNLNTTDNPDDYDCDDDPNRFDILDWAVTVDETFQMQILGLYNFDRYLNFTPNLFTVRNMFGFNLLHHPVTPIAYEWQRHIFSPNNLELMLEITEVSPSGSWEELKSRYEQMINWFGYSQRSYGPMGEFNKRSMQTYKSMFLQPLYDPILNYPPLSPDHESNNRRHRWQEWVVARCWAAFASYNLYRAMPTFMLHFESYDRLGEIPISVRTMSTMEGIMRFLRWEWHRYQHYRPVIQPDGEVQLMRTAGGPLLSAHTITYV